MNVVGATEYDFIVPRRVRRAIYTAVFVVAMLVTPFRNWLIGQVVSYEQNKVDSYIQQFEQTTVITRPMQPHQGRHHHHRQSGPRAEHEHLQPPIGASSRAH
jgi:hypothetical protein